MERRRLLLLTFAGYLQSSTAIFTKFFGQAAAAPMNTPNALVSDKPIWDLVSLPVLTIPKDIVVPPGTKDIFIPVSVDRTDRQSFIAYIDRLVNVRFGGINVGDADNQRANFDALDVLYHWSPFDDLIHWVRVSPKTNYEDGNAFKVSIRVKGLGEKQNGRVVTVRFAKGAQEQIITPQFHRPLRRLNLSQAIRKNSFDPAMVEWSPDGFKGKSPVFMSALHNGRSQDGNGETGLYSDETVDGAENPISYDISENAIRLHTMAHPINKRVEWNGRLWRHQSAVLHALTMDDLCGTDGVWRMEAKIPIRRYSWPAFWLIGRGVNRQNSAYSMWPPEIDILETFNWVYGNDTPYTSSFAQHFGPAGKWDKKLGSFGNDFEIYQYGHAEEPLDSSYHSWACAVVYNPQDTTKSEVTFFFDDMEVGCHVLHARHEDLNRKMQFYPTVNVAVMAPEDYTPEEYNTDNGRGHSGDMLVRDIAYFPSGFNFF